MQGADDAHPRGKTCEYAPFLGESSCHMPRFSFVNPHYTVIQIVVQERWYKPYTYPFNMVCAAFNLIPGHGTH